MFDQFISKETDPHWGGLFEQKQKLQSCTRLCSLFSQTADLIISRALTMGEAFSTTYTPAHPQRFLVLISYLLATEE